MGANQLLLLLTVALLLALLLALVLPLRRGGTPAPPPAEDQPSHIFARGDDRYWYGFFYYNPDDPDPFVPKRYGLGWTINFGHPLGKLFAALLLALALVPAVVALLAPGLAATGCHTFGCVPPAP
ncbi:MAG TPA: DUF5808 domain-containing protein [Ktedonobacterales bacterium]